MILPLESTSVFVVARRGYHFSPCDTHPCLLLLRRDTKTSRDTPPLWFFDLLFAKIYDGIRDGFFNFWTTNRVIQIVNFIFTNPYLVLFSFKIKFEKCTLRLGWRISFTINTVNPSITFPFSQSRTPLFFWNKICKQIPPARLNSILLIEFYHELETISIDRASSIILTAIEF